jgi:hypothetical protein
LDVLGLNRKNVRSSRLTVRKRLLRKIIRGGSRALRYAQHVVDQCERATTEQRYKAAAEQSDDYNNDDHISDYEVAWRMVLRCHARRVPATYAAPRQRGIVREIDEGDFSLTSLRAVAC